MTDGALIEAKHVDRYYGKTCAVRDLSLTIHRGEVLGFLGPNGAGKSTSMRIIAGTLAPSAGSVKVGGNDILEQSRAAKALIGYLPEQPPLYRDATVDEYLTYCGRLHRIPASQLHESLCQVKNRCGLEDAGRRLIGNLSKGYQQRVGIAQAVIHAPAIVILDEPTVGLDPIQIREIRALIKELGADHSVILSTHILPEVQAVCNRVSIIHQGQLVLDEQLDSLDGEPCVRLRIGFQHPPEPTSLQSLAGVAAVTPIDERRFRIESLVDSDPTEMLVHRSVQENWGLFELVRERRSLEDTFVQLTCGDEGARQELQTEKAA